MYYKILRKGKNKKIRNHRPADQTYEIWKDFMNECWKACR